ncbi:MAG: exodeoxyribonuclease III [Acidimicrobiales bacterium]|nr:exodeoxyribonuclease III [Acidimicrobiales bacterium]
MSDSLRIATWNVNSIRVRADQVIEWLVRHEVDVALIQETKCRDGDFPFPAFASAGYEVAHHGVDHWNGVAIVSRVGIDDIVRGFSGPQEAPFDEARVIAATCAGVRCWSVYVPNGRELWDPHYAFKLVWLERLRHELVLADAASGSSLVAGDFNVAPTDDDIYMPSRWRRRTHASEPERAGIRALVDIGLRDVTREHHPEPGFYTWWNYRPGQFEKDHGLRIDLALGSAPVARRTDDVWVDREARACARPSDHAPLVLDLTGLD